MLKLMKYDLRGSCKPFVWIFLLNTVLMALGLIGAFSKKSYEFFSGLYMVEDVILVMAGSMYIYKEFCTEELLLSKMIPVSKVKRFFSKFIVLVLCFIGVQISKLVYNLLLPLGLYNSLAKLIVNYKPYILYDFTGGIVTYTSTLAIVVFGLMLGSSITRKGLVRPILNTIIIVALCFCLLNIYQNTIYGNYGAKSAIEFKLRENVTGTVNINFRKDYTPFNYASVGTVMAFQSTASPHVIWDGYSWVGVEYSVVLMLIALIGSTGILMWRGRQ